MANDKKRGYMNSDELWAGELGNQYNIRNANPAGIINNKALFAKMSIKDINTALELGCGYGYSLLALKELFPHLELTGVEINKAAFDIAKSYGITALNKSIYNISLPKKYDLVLTKGILMYVTEEKIYDIYKLLFESSSKYICICEYYNPNTVTIDHRGNALYKRDYGKIMDLYPLELVDYGFVYHRDKFPQDDITWFLFKK